MDKYLKMELFVLGFYKTILSLLPKKFRYRVANFLYPFDRGLKNGVWLVVPYLDKHLNLKFLLNTKEHIGWNIFFFGTYESETNRIIEQYIKPGMTIVEAGANSGSESVLIGKLTGPNGKLYAFEPVQSVARQLKVNILLNNLEDIIIIEHLALGEKNDEVEFYLTEEDTSNQGMSSKYVFQEARRIELVQQVSLDSWIEKKSIEKIDFIKMDIQGAEIDLIAGADKCLLEMKPILYLEADEVQAQNGKNTLIDLFNSLDKYGYSVSRIMQNESVSINRNNIKPGNWLAIPKVN